MTVCRERGQALTEFIVIALVLIPLFLLLPMIGKYLDIAHATQMASRYVAFEAMQRNGGTADGWKPPEQLAGEVRRRFLGQGDTAIKTNDTGEIGSNAFWKDNQGNALIADPDTDVRISFGLQGTGTTHESGLRDSADRTPFMMVDQALGLPMGGIYTANVSVNLANPAEPAEGFARSFEFLGNLNLGMKRHTSVVVGAWPAKDPAYVRDRIDKPSLVPGTMLAAAKPAVDAAVYILESPGCLNGGCKPPKLGELQFWDDVVPPDRLK